MSRKPSAETELRNTKRELKQQREGRLRLVGENARQASRIAELERDNARWQARFDQLLKLQGPKP